MKSDSSFNVKRFGNSGRKWINFIIFNSTRLPQDSLLQQRIDSNTFCRCSETRNSVALNEPVKMGRFCDGVSDCEKTTILGTILDNLQEDECNNACDRHTSMTCWSLPRSFLVIDPYPPDYIVRCALSEVNS